MLQPVWLVVLFPVVALLCGWHVQRPKGSPQIPKGMQGFISLVQKEGSAIKRPVLNCLLDIQRNPRVPEPGSPLYSIVITKAIALAKVFKT